MASTPVELARQIVFEEESASIRGICTPWPRSHVEVARALLASHGEREEGVMWIGVNDLGVPDISTLHVDERDCQELIDDITYPDGQTFTARRCTLLIHQTEGASEGPPSDEVASTTK